MIQKFIRLKVCNIMQQLLTRSCRPIMTLFIIFLTTAITKLNLNNSSNILCHLTLIKHRVNLIWICLLLLSVIHLPYISHFFLHNMAIYWHWLLLLLLLLWHCEITRYWLDSTDEWALRTHTSTKRALWRFIAWLATKCM